MRRLRGHLIGLLLLCLVLRLAAWLVTPLIPLLVVLSALICLLYFIFFGRYG